MKRWHACRTAAMALTITGLVFPSPMAWAQLETVDPVLAVAVEALVTRDPEVAGDPELAALCRTIAEASVSDIRERAVLESEAATLVREGVDLSTVIPDTVRTEAREQFAKVQSDMQQELETLRATDPEKAKEIELMLREGERQMQAFESGEHYTPSAEMASHAKEMFTEWKDTMSEQGASPEFLARAEMEFGRWSSGEIMGPMGGPGQDMMGPGNMPSLEQMEGMVASGQMSSEQLQMAKEYMANPQEFMSTHSGYETFGPEAMGSGGPPGGTWEGGPHEGMTEYAGMNPTDAFEHWAAENPNVSSEQMEQYREMAEQYQPENQNYDTQQQQQYDQSQPASSQPAGAETLVRTEIHAADHNGDGDATDPVDSHPHEIYRHGDGTCHDHADQSAEAC